MPLIIFATIIYMFACHENHMLGQAIIWHPGLWNKEFFVCSNDFQIKSIVSASDLLECSLLCSSHFSCLSFNFLPSESACQMFSYISRHFLTNTTAIENCIYFYQSQVDIFGNKRINLALGKPSNASAIYQPVALPSKAVDGIRSGSYELFRCSHTSYWPPNWWSVDLLNVYTIYYVMLVNRNSAGERLNRYIVGLNNTLKALITRWDYDLCGQYPGNTTSSSWYITLCKEYPYGHRYVILQSATDYDHYLTICEFEVYGDL